MMCGMRKTQASETMHNQRTFKSMVGLHIYIIALNAKIIKYTSTPIFQS